VAIALLVTFAYPSGFPWPVWQQTSNGCRGWFRIIILFFSPLGATYARMRTVVLFIAWMVMICGLWTPHNLKRT